MTNPKENTQRGDKIVKLGIIIPCKDEKDTLQETSQRVTKLLKEMSDKGTISTDSFICYVDDGSIDNTWEIIEELKTSTKIVRGLKLSRNFGHQNALISGLMRYKDEVDALISMDADLQDDIMAIKEFVEKFKEGHDIVYGVRKDRSKDTGFKRGTAGFFYGFQKAMGIETVANHADYRLMSSRAINALAEFQEIDLFLRGIVPMLGFRSCNVYYDRGERFAGESKYPTKRMILFAIDGITSFSMRPLRIITMIGFALFMLSLVGIAWVGIEKFILGSTVQGWSSMMVSMYFIGGVQIMALGIIGEYVGRNFQQGKQRPRYIVDKEI